MLALSGWVGCYTSQSGGDPDGGIGRLTSGPGGSSVHLAAGVSDPSYLARSADGRFLYAVQEAEQGTVTSFGIQGDSLRRLSARPTGGAHPCHVLAHPDGRFVLAANYSSGSVSVHPVGGDGRLGELTDLVQHEGSGPDAGRQDGPHAHQVVADPSGEHVFAVDLGIDAVVTYRLDHSTGRLAERDRLVLPPGTGPRHLAFHPSGHAAYLVGELTSTLTTVRHEHGHLTAVSTVSTRPASAAGPNLPAAVVVTSDGKQVHVGNRGDDTVATFQLAGGGLLARLATTVPCGGSWPRDLVVDPDGGLLACNERSGGIHRVGAAPLAKWPAPTCLVLDREA